MAMAEHTTAGPRAEVAERARDFGNRPVPGVVEALARAHQALLQDLLRPEATARAAEGGTLAEARAWLVAVRAHLAEHFRFEEEDGYLDAVRNREPRLERAAEQLAEEHRRLMRALDELLEEAARTVRLDDGLREGVRRWVKEVRKHEARENDLVQDAFTQDLGTKD
jgi:hemerythrin